MNFIIHLMKTKVLLNHIKYTNDKIVQDVEKLILRKKEI